jgi:chemotaxis protein MotB
MKKLIFYSFVLLTTTGLLSSCVSKRKFVSSQNKVKDLQSDNVNLNSKISDCNASVKKLQGQKSSLEEANASAQKDLQTLSSKSNLTIEDQAKRLQSLQDIIRRQREVMNKLKQSVIDALVNLKADELSVYLKDGKVYVSLSENLLFKSGSAVVDPKGKEALKKLCQVLNATKDINILIEGHTDTIPIKTDQFTDNWALSVSRATSIVRILTIDNGFDEHHIIASGRSKFQPIMTNSTPEGRAGNRRTEIILSPDMNELFRLLEI